MRRILLSGALALLVGACGRETVLVAPTAAVAPAEGTAPAEAEAETTTVPPSTAPTVTTTAPTTAPTTTATTTAPARPAMPQVTAAPRMTATTRRPTATTATATAACHPSYTGACLPPDASDVDCEGGSGNGPAYTGRVQVVGPDVFDLDRDSDGVGCE